MRQIFLSVLPPDAVDQLIGLLLRDFEESTSDWLWQTNADGVLEDIPLVVNTAVVHSPRESEIPLNVRQFADGRVMLNMRNLDPAQRRAITVSNDGATGWAPVPFATSAATDVA